MSKLINVSNVAYKELSKRKNGKSFSEVILDLTSEKKKGNAKEILEKYFGIDKEGRMFDEKAIKELRKDWKRWTKRYV